VTTAARRRFLMAGLAVALGAALAAPPAGAQAVRREQLANGMTVIVRESPATPVVALSLLVRMGSRWERPDRAGLTNFVHAVMVKGTARRTGAELAEAVALLGGKISAAGDVDYSGISAQALARFWKELLGITAELALEPRLTAEDVQLERDWLLSRIQRRSDSPSARAFDEFYAAVYGDHPYGRPVLGTPETLRRIDHPAIVAAYRAAYAPERMVLAVSGQVQAAEVVAEVRRLFEARPRGAGAPPPANPAPRAGVRRIVVEQPAQQAQILTGGLAPALDHPDHAAVKVLSAVLGGGMAGRLFAELRDRQALAYTASAYYDPVKEPGLLTLYLGTAPENVERAEAALLREVERVRQEPVGADELRRAKGYLLGSYAMDRRTNARQAWHLGFYEVEAVGLDYPDRYRQAVSAVTAADLQRVARAYLAGPTTVVLRPPTR
jgi:predicted Zn-dependent peptidase